MSPEKEFATDVEVVTHLGYITGLLNSGSMDENDIDNADETHFVFKVDNIRTLGFSGTDDVMYADEVIEGKGFTMFVRISGGSRFVYSTTVPCI